MASESIARWLSLWTMFALASLGIQSTVWTAAVASVFSESRSLAIGITVSGGALSQILVPPVTYWLIEGFGWRLAYVLLAAGWGGTVLVLVLLFMFDAHARQSKLQPRSPEANRTRQPGLTLHEAVRNVALWRIAIASFLTMLFGVGVMVHQVPILTEVGVTRSDAALLASLAGAAGIVGKLVTGYLMDRRDAGLIGGITLALGGLGFLLLEVFHAPVLIILAMLIIGYSTGAKLQISAYLVSRYAGMRHFALIFGSIVSLIGLGASIGPLLAGVVHDLYGSYSVLLLIGIPGSVVSGILIIGLGPYPTWNVSSR